jgi:hypothetical protein
LTGRRRPLYRIVEILDGLSFISSRSFRKECAALGVSVRNVFPDMVDVMMREGGGSGGRLRSALRLWPEASMGLARLVATAGLEPQMYYFIRARRLAHSREAFALKQVGLPEQAFDR